MGRHEGKRPFASGVTYREFWWGDVRERDRLGEEYRTEG